MSVNNTDKWNQYVDNLHVRMKAALDRGDEDGVAELEREFEQKERKYLAQQKRGGLHAVKDGPSLSWGEPEELPRLPPAPEFKPEFFPDRVRGIGMNTSRRIQCPPDYVAAPMFCAFGSLIGLGCGIRPMVRDHHTVIPNMFGAIVGRPSQRKSSPVKEVMKPLKSFEAEAAAEHKEKEFDRVAVAKKLAALKNKLGNDNVDLKSSRKDFEQFTQEGEDLSRYRRFVTQDPTVEKLQMILAQSPRGVAVWRDELIGWLRSMAMNGRENERSFYLEAWSGDSSYTSDRVERGTTRTENACVSVFGTIQPGKLDEYLRSAMAKGGKGNDGLINRFQLLVYPEPKTTWEEVDQVPDPEEAANYLNTARRIAFAAPEDLGAEIGVTGIPFLRFSTEDGAQDRFRRWQKAHMNRLFGGDEHPLMEDHLGKYVSLVPSLALVFHLIDVGAGPVQDASLKRAIEYVAYLEGHARRLFASNIEEDVTTAKLILKKLISGKLALTFQGRDVYRAGWSGLGETEMVLKGVRCLIEFGYVQETKSETGAIWFHAHPELP